MKKPVPYEELFATFPPERQHYRITAITGHYRDMISIARIFLGSLCSGEFAALFQCIQTPSNRRLCLHMQTLLARCSCAAAEYRMIRGIATTSAFRGQRLPTQYQQMNQVPPKPYGLTSAAQ